MICVFTITVILHLSFWCELSLHKTTLKRETVYSAGVKIVGLRLCYQGLKFTELVDLLLLHCKGPITALRHLGGDAFTGSPNDLGLPLLEACLRSSNDMGSYEKIMSEIKTLWLPKQGFVVGWFGRVVTVVHDTVLIKGSTFTDGENNGREWNIKRLQSSCWCINPIAHGPLDRMTYIWVFLTYFQDITLLCIKQHLMCMLYIVMLNGCSKIEMLIYTHTKKDR